MGPNSPRTSPPAPVTQSKAALEPSTHMKPTNPTKVNNIEEGRTLLEEKGYLIAGEKFQLEQLSIVLFQMAKAMPQTQKAVVDGIQYVQ